MSNIEYMFSGKPSFPKLGVKLPDNIDWTKTNVDPFTHAVRHTRSQKLVLNVDKSREPTEKQRSELFKVISKQKVVARKMLSKNK